MLDNIRHDPLVELVMAAGGSGGDYDAGYKAGYDAGYPDGYDEGYAEAEAEYKGSGYDEGYADGRRDGEEAGYDRGYAEGDAAGKVAGYDAGYKAGDSDGYDRGYDEGETDGWEQGQIEGYESGYAAGEKAGDAAGYERGDQEGYVRGYAEGLTAGLSAGYADGYEAGKSAGDAEGYARGYGEGESAGEAAGYDKGHDAGYAEGYEAGAAEAWEVLPEAKIRDGYVCDIWLLIDTKNNDPAYVAAQYLTVGSRILVDVGHMVDGAFVPAIETQAYTATSTIDSGVKTNDIAKYIKDAGLPGRYFTAHVYSDFQRSNETNGRICLQGYGIVDVALAFDLPVVCYTYMSAFSYANYPIGAKSARVYKHNGNLRWLFRGADRLEEAVFFDEYSGNQRDNMNLYSAFYGCESLRRVTGLRGCKAGESLNMAEAFRFCSNLTSALTLDLSGATSLSAAFSGCSSMEDVSGLDLSNAVSTDMASLFSSCSSIRRIGSIKLPNDSITGTTTSSPTPTSNSRNMFNGCDNLEEIELLNVIVLSSSSRQTRITRSGTCIGALSLAGTEEQPRKLRSLRMAFRGEPSFVNYGKDDFKYADLDISYCSFEEDALRALFEDLYDYASTDLAQTLNVIITGNPGADGIRQSTIDIARNKGWDVVGATNIIDDNTVEGMLTLYEKTRPAGYDVLPEEPNYYGANVFYAVDITSQNMATMIQITNPQFSSSTYEQKNQWPPDAFGMRGKTGPIYDGLTLMPDDGATAVLFEIPPGDGDKTTAKIAGAYEVRFYDGQAFSTEFMDYSTVAHLTAHFDDEDAANKFVESEIPKFAGLKSYVVYIDGKVVASKIL